MGIMFSVKSSILAALNWPLPNVNAKQAGVSSKMLAPAKLLTCTATHKVVMTRIAGHVGKSEEIPIASAISSRTSEDFSPKDTTRIRAGRLPGDLDELPSGSPCQRFGVRLPKEVPHH